MNKYWDLHTAMNMKSLCISYEHLIQSEFFRAEKRILPSNRNEKCFTPYTHVWIWEILKLLIACKGFSQWDTILNKISFSSPVIESFRWHVSLNWHFFGFNFRAQHSSSEHLPRNWKSWNFTQQIALKYAAIAVIMPFWRYMLPFTFWPFFLCFHHLNENIKCTIFKWKCSSCMLY